MSSTRAKPETDALTLFGTSSSDVRERWESWRSMATRELTERPLRTLGLTLGAGYLLGGGLFSRLTWRVGKLALRFGLPAILSVVQDQDEADSAQADTPPASDDQSTSSAKRDLGSRKRRAT